MDEVCELAVDVDGHTGLGIQGAYTLQDVATDAICLKPVPEVRVPDRVVRFSEVHECAVQALTLASGRLNQVIQDEGLLSGAPLRRKAALVHAA
jgi:hypothetical protein